MHNINKYIISIVGLFFLLFSSSFSEENGTGLTSGLEMDFVSRYVWHGIAYSDGMVKQTSVWASMHDFTLTIWDNYVLNNEPNHFQVNESDLSLSYTKEINRFTIEPTVNYYWYTNQEEAPSTAELAVKLAYTLDPIELFTNQSIDIKEYDGAYFGEIGIGYSRELNPQLSFEGTVLLGWASSKFNETYLGLAKSAMNVAQCEVALNYTLESSVLPGLYFRPHLAVSAILDSELQDQLDDSTILYGGVAIGKEF